MPLWRRTLYTVWITQLIAVMGFSFVTPFLPYYIQELGITDTTQASLWAGLVTSATAVSMTLSSPIWGALADRHGRKLMVLRASFAGAVVMGVMGFVTNVQQLLVLRFLQGILTGTVSATTTLVASTTPREHSGAALGSLQTAIFLGVSLGPFLGGIMGDRFGFRSSFWITGTLLFVSGVLVAIFVHEDFHPAADVTRRGLKAYSTAIRVVLASGALLAAFAARIFLRLGTRALDPVLPLFVQTLLPAGAAVGTTTGIIAASTTLGAAGGSILFGHWADRAGHRSLLIGSAFAAGLLYVPMAFVTDPRWLIFWSFLNGTAVGGTLATLTALLVQITPAGREGIVFGLDSSAVSGANAVGPLAGAIAAANLGLRAPFFLAALTFGIGGLAVIFWVHDRGSQQTAQPEQGT